MPPVQGVPAPEMVNCVISVDVVGIVVGIAHAKLSLVQQVSQLSPALQTVFREAVVLELPEQAQKRLPFAFSGVAAHVYATLGL